MAPQLDLPLSSSFANAIPSHPLPSLLLSPVLPRLAFLESALLSSAPAKLLLRLGLGPKTILLLSFAGFARLSTKYRAQWRALLGLLGVAEALGRTVGVLDALEQRRSAEQADRKGKGRPTRLKEEAKHVLSWWMLYALVVLAEGLHPDRLPSLAALSLPALPQVDWHSLATLPALSTLSDASGNVLFALRKRLIPLLRQFPSLALRFPSLLLSPNSRPARSTRRPFPQPRPLTGTTSSSLSPSLPVALCGSEVRWAVVKLLLLWTGLRRDGFGASVLWDWIVGPICAISGARGKPSRIVKVVLADRHADAEVETTSTPPRLTLATLPIPGPDVFDLDAASDDGSSTHSSHSYAGDTAHATPTFSHSYSTIDSRSPHSPPPSQSQPGQGRAFPTPSNVPFKMASSREPVRGASFHGSVASDGGSAVSLGRYGEEEGGRW